MSLLISLISGHLVSQLATKLLKTSFFESNENAPNFGSVLRAARRFFTQTGFRGDVDGSKKILAAVRLCFKLFIGLRIMNAQKYFL